MLHAGRGAALLKQKLRRVAPSDSPSCPATIRRVSKPGGVFHNLAATTTGKNLPEESIGFRGGRCHVDAAPKGGAMSRMRGGRCHVDNFAFPRSPCGQYDKIW
jgi:hypothetical protein